MRATPAVGQRCVGAQQASCWGGNDGEEPAAEAARGRSTVRDMVLSLGVVGAAIAIFVAAAAEDRPPEGDARSATYPRPRRWPRRAPLPILVPQPLPAGWQANYVRIDNAPDGLHVGFVLDSKRFARLDETAKPSAAFYKSAYVNPSATRPQPQDASAGVPAGFEVRRSGKHVALLQAPDRRRGAHDQRRRQTSSGASLRGAGDARAQPPRAGAVAQDFVRPRLSAARLRAWLAYRIEAPPRAVQPVLALAGELLAALPERQRLLQRHAARLQPAHDVFELGAGLLVGLRAGPWPVRLLPWLTPTTSTSSRPSASRTASRSPAATVAASRSTAPSCALHDRVAAGQGGGRGERPHPGELRAASRGARGRSASRRCAGPGRRSAATSCERREHAGLRVAQHRAGARARRYGPARRRAARSPPGAPAPAAAGRPGAARRRPERRAWPRRSGWRRGRRRRGRAAGCPARARWR